MRRLEYSVAASPSRRCDPRLPALTAGIGAPGISRDQCPAGSATVLISDRSCFDSADALTAVSSNSGPGCRRPQGPDEISTIASTGRAVRL